MLHVLRVSEVYFESDKSRLIESTDKQQHCDSRRGRLEFTFMPPETFSELSFVKISLKSELYTKSLLRKT